MTNRAPKILLALMVAAGAALAQSTAPAPSPAAETTPAAGTGTSDASSIVLAQRPREFAPAQPADSDGVTRSVSPASPPRSRRGWRSTAPEPHADAGGAAAEPRTCGTSTSRGTRSSACPSTSCMSPGPHLPGARPQHDRRPDRPLVQEPPGSPLRQHPRPELRRRVRHVPDDQRQQNIDELTDIAHAMSRGGPEGGGLHPRADAEHLHAHR